MSGENYINHIALVLDASGSMEKHRHRLVQVADDQIAYLAERSKDLDQETRVTVYTFDDTVRCAIYDKDVLRLPSIKTLYRIGGMTALIDATLKSQEDLEKTAQIYGDHAFLTYVLSDGLENRSRRRQSELERYLERLQDNWTVAALVPDQKALHQAQAFGFPAGNVEVWDAKTDAGLQEVGSKIRMATDTFMVNRASGIRGSRSIFSMGADALNRRTVQQARLQAVWPGSYQLLPVTDYDPLTIRDFVEKGGYQYRIGSAYYQLSKTETIQKQKDIAVYQRSTGTVYTGAQARALLGLPDMTVRVKPDHNPDFDVFVQSTSVNRRLVPATNLLLFPNGGPR